MGMTITEKILAKHARRHEVTAGDNVWVDVDVLMTHDVCGPGAIAVFTEQFGADAKVWDPGKIVIIPDHYIFTADAKAHRNIDILRRFVAEQGIANYYDPDFVQGDGMPRPYDDPTQTPYQGVCHSVLPEKGHTRPGEILLGTDSHTCTAGAFGQFATGIGNTEAGFVMGTGKLWLKVPPTLRFILDGAMPPYLMAKDVILRIIGDLGVAGAAYCAMEFTGSAIKGMSIDERMTLCNMAIEAGGKNGVVPADEVTVEYVRARTDVPFECVGNDPDAVFQSERTYDVSTAEPVVARPHSPDNVATVRDVAGTPLDRAYIGSCTGGKLADFEAAARILAGRSVKIDTFCVPANTRIDADLSRKTCLGKTLRRILQDAGCQIGPASCAACLGGPDDTFGRANSAIKVISATNRNFPGRMGSQDAQVFLASPLTVAASAVAGRITDPRDLLQ
ncbi:MAG: 3-isopropylmalate dehydratase large subunit [Phycisphaerae bacterium]|nr:3-isopropylmalate dehydratase large subunit [Phycisphaerae bacterium]